MKPPKILLFASLFCCLSVNVLLASEYGISFLKKSDPRLNFKTFFPEHSNSKKRNETLKSLSNNHFIFTEPSISFPTAAEKFYAGLPITPFIVKNNGGAVPGIMANEVTTVAGDGKEGMADHTNGLLASFGLPNGVATDIAGNIYISDVQNNKIRKLSTNGTVSTYAGSGEAGSSDNLIASLATFYGPSGIAIDFAGNIYVAERLANKVRKISPSGIVTTIAGSGASGWADNENGLLATFNGPEGITVDGSGTVYVADRFNRRIRKISPTGSVTTIAGSGEIGSTDHVIGTRASFGNPYGVAVDRSGNIFVADRAFHIIRKISPAGSVTTLAGDGTAGAIDNTIGTLARFRNPFGIGIDQFDNLYVSELGNNRIRKITPAGAVTTLAGSGAIGSADAWDSLASFNAPRGVAADLFGNLYVADGGNRKIRKIKQLGYTISPALPAGLIFDPSAGTITGTPTELLSPTDFFFTATNTDGASRTSITITVVNRPHITTTGELTSLISCYGKASAVPQSILVSGDNLEGMITVTVPGGFEISLSPTNGYTNSVQLSPVNGAVIPSSVFIRLAVTDLPDPSGDILITSANAVTKTISVNGIINPLPVINGILNLCEGSSTELSGSTTPATLNPWVSGNSNIATVNEIGVINAVAPGSTSIIYTNNHGCSIASILTIKTRPEAPIASVGGAVCSGSPLLLTASQVPGASYWWSGPNGFSSAIQNPIIPNPDTAASGIYTLTISINGCNSEGASVRASVKAIPQAPMASGGGSICEGKTLSLYSSTIAGASYLWSGPDNFHSVIQNPVIEQATTTATGTYFVSVTINGCESSLSNVMATVKQVPPAPHLGTGGTVCAGEALSLTAGLIPGASYTWTGPGNFLSFIQNPVINNATIAASGTYLGKATVDGCSSSLSTIQAIVKQVPASPIASTGGVICAGSPLLLITDSIPGATYVWSGPDNFSSTKPHSIIAHASLSASGVYTVSVIKDGCKSAATSVLAMVKAIPPAPFPSSGGSICSGANLFLYASPVKDATYHWTGPDKFNAVVQNPVIPGATRIASGEYTVTAMVNGCSSVAAKVLAIVKPQPPPPLVSNDESVCSGASVTLHAGTIENAVYEWSGPDDFHAEIQNPVIQNANITATGVYKVTASIDGCKSQDAEVFVVVKPKPQAPIANTAGSVCSGSTLSLNVGSIPDASYIWTGPDNFKTTDQNPLVVNASVAASGIYTVIANVGGCSSDASDVFAIVKPTPLTPEVSSDGDICLGATANLYAYTKENVTYTWTGPDNFHAAIQNPIISNAKTTAAGVYSVTASLDGCISPPGQIFLTVNPVDLAIISPDGPTIFCSGDSSTLSAGAGKTYLWSTGDTTKTIVVHKQGNYSVRVVGDNGCKSLPSDSIVIKVFPSPIPSDISIDGKGTFCEGDSVTLRSAIEGSQLHWFRNDIAIAGANNKTYTTKSSGVYSLHYSDSNGCKARTGNREVIINPLPLVDKITGVKNICLGDSIHIGNLTPSGVWHSSNPDIASISSTGSVLGKSAGTVSISYSSISQSGCLNAVSDTLTIYSLPVISPIIGANRVCAGDTTSFKCYTPGGKWSTSSITVVAKINSSGLVTGYSAGVDTVIYAISNHQGCVSTELQEITVNPLPVVSEISGNKNVCAGEYTMLSNSMKGGTWSTQSNLYFQVDSVGLVRGLNAGTGTIYYTIKDTSGCIGAAKTLINVNGLPKVTATSSVKSIHKGGTVQLQAITTGYAATYAWKPSGSLNDSTSANPIARILANTSYYVTVRSFQGCLGEANVSIEAMEDLNIQHSILLTPNGDGVNDLFEIKNLDIYPNNKLRVYDRNGKMLYVKNNYSNNWNGTFDGKLLARDTYFYILTVNEQVVRKGTITIYR